MQEVPGKSIFTVLFVLRALQYLINKTKLMSFGALRVAPPTTANMWAWIFNFLFFWRCWCGDAFCTDMPLQTDDVTHRNLYTEQPVSVYAPTQRGCARKKRSHTPKRLYTQRFIQQNFYTKMLLHATFSHRRLDRHRCFFTHCFHAQKILHRNWNRSSHNCFCTRNFPPKKNRNSGIWL